MMNEINAMDNVLQNLSLKFMSLQKYNEALKFGKHCEKDWRTLKVTL